MVIGITVKTCVDLINNASQGCILLMLKNQW